MPAARYFANVAFNPATGKIIVQGGFDDALIESSQTWEYDPTADSWSTTRAASPVPLTGSGTSIIGQHMYVMGRWNGGAASNVNYRYDLIGNVWTAMTPVPTSMYAPAVGIFNNRIYLVGGGDPARHGDSFRPGTSPDASFTTTHLYDPGTNSWSAGPNTLVPHSFTAGTVVGNNMFVVGGFNGSADTNAVEKLNLGCPSISGRITYENSLSLVPVAGTNLNGSGGPGLFVSTDLSGNYSLTGFGMESFTIAPNRPNMLFSVERHL